MRFFVFSDSHGDSRLMRKIAGNADKIDGIIFLGDYLRDIEHLQKDFSKLAFHIVPGNCDFLSPKPLEKLVEIGGEKILITHGHKYGVKAGYERILTAALQMGANAAFFGHSHIPIKSEKNGVILLNPGSITEPRGNAIRRSYAIIDIDDGKITPQIIEV
ncbi:MAG: metallophosphoesterase [Defluviitaleaceae bacterium]|nr:metallophosphoesterase [Defluviitaleaceae bacterium]